jgi:hypothetical protein
MVARTTAIPLKTLSMRRKADSAEKLVTGLASTDAPPALSMVEAYCRASVPGDSAISYRSTAACGSS